MSAPGTHRRATARCADRGAPASLVDSRRMGSLTAEVDLAPEGGTPLFTLVSS